MYIYVHIFDLSLFARLHGIFFVQLNIGLRGVVTPFACQKEQKSCLHMLKRKNPINYCR